MDKNYLQYFHFSYTQEHLKQLEAIENELKFSHFDSQDALNLGLSVLDVLKQYQKDIESIISYLNNLTLSEKFKCFSNFNFIRLILLLHCLPLFKLLISTIDCK